MQNIRAYLDLIDSNLDLREKLAQETVETIKNKRKICKLIKDLEQCELYIKYLEKNLISKEDEIEQLKVKCQSIQYELDKCCNHLDLKEEALVVQDERIIQLEDTVDKLKNQIIEISIFKNNKETDQQSMAATALNQIMNIATALDRIERYIGGDQSSDPINNLNFARTTLANLRAQFLTLGHQITMDANTINNLQVLLNNTNRAANFHLQNIANLRNSILQREQNLIQNWRIEVNRRLQWYQFARDLQTYGQRIAERKQNRINTLLHEKTVLRLFYRKYKNDAELAEFNHAWAFNHYQKWKARELNSRQIILNLQNNLPGNMATIHEIYQILAPALGQIPIYTGQYTPDDYIQKVTNVFESAAAVITAANTANANTFVDVQKCDILKSKMGNKFTPVPANDPYTQNTPLINTPATFTVWLRHKYREVMAGNAELALQSLIQERFNPTDSPDTYETRVRKHIVGFADDQILPALYTHLPPDLRNSVKIYMTIRGAGAANQTVDNFFTDLRKCWVERQVGVSTFNQSNIEIQSQSAIHPQINSSKANDFIIRLAKDLQYSGLKSDYETLEKYIYDELQNRLGGSRIAAHNRKSPFDSINTNASRRVVKKKSPKVTTKII